MSILVIAEKPSVARDIAKALDCHKRGDGFLYGENYIISWAIGHLVGLCEPDEYDMRYKKWTMDSLPIIPAKMQLKVLPKTKSQYGVLKKLMSAAETEHIVCATDSGREGELIFRYIYTITGCRKPFQRLWISSMTTQAIKKGFATLRDGHEYDNLYESARCRSEADWLVGINASRAYTLNYGTLLSIGRVQTPTLGIIVEKQKEIEAFKPEKYWVVEAKFDRQDGNSYTGIWFDAKTEETKIDSMEKSENIVALIKRKKAEITDITSVEKKIPPPLLFDLTELQRECNRKFGYTAKKTLDTAQNLYEKYKAITYPRTDSRYLTADMAVGVRKVLEGFGGDLAELAAYPLSLPSLPFSKRIVDDSKVTDHHAIIPTGKAALNLPEAERNIYDLIARRLIAAFYKDYRYAVTKVVTVCERESFLSKGVEVVVPGWTSVLGRYEQSDTESSAILPAMTVGDGCIVHSANSKSKTTQPPKPYTEATLLSAMENAGRFVEDEELKEKLKESGLGTPATRAAIIERLIDVGYVERVKKSLKATEKGVKLIEIVPKELKSPETTAKWEKALTQISKGKMDTVKFNKSIENYVRYIITESKKLNTNIAFDTEITTPERSRSKKKSQAPKLSNGVTSLGKCILCDGNVHENSKAYYCSNWRNGCRFTVWKNALTKSGAELTKEMVGQLLAEGKISNVPVLLSSTNERGECTVTLNKELQGYIGISNFTRKEVK